jgi:hypothetical protein
VSYKGLQMKNISFLVVVVSLALALIACGKKEESSSKPATNFSSNPYAVSTFDSLVNVDTYAVVVGSATYQPSQEGVQVLANAFTQASKEGIPLNSARQLKVKITGLMQNVATQQPTTNQQQQAYLQVQQAIVYR